MIQAHIFYSGRVQGVGFRFTAERYALAAGLKGWVKNLPNGYVEILVEGPKEKIEEFCQDVESHFQDYIKDKTIDFTLAQGIHSDFRVMV